LSPQNIRKTPLREIIFALPNLKSGDISWQRIIDNKCLATRIVTAEGKHDAPKRRSLSLNGCCHCHGLNVAEHKDREA
jgi:hypothetical protein